jgi:hypothetical protein
MVSYSEKEKELQGGTKHSQQLLDTCCKSKSKGTRSGVPHTKKTPQDDSGNFWDTRSENKMAHE